MKYTSTLRRVEKKMTHISYVFAKLQTVKNLVRPMSKKSRFWTRFDSQHVKRSKTLVNSAWQDFYHSSLLLWANLTWKMFLLVISKILGQFLNTSTADDKYSVSSKENFPQPVQQQFSKKPIVFSESSPTFRSISEININV